MTRTKTPSIFLAIPYSRVRNLWWASIALSSQVQILEKLDCVRLISVLTIQEKIVLVLNDIRSPSPYLARVELT